MRLGFFLLGALVAVAACGENDDAGKPSAGAGGSSAGMATGGSSHAGKSSGGAGTQAGSLSAAGADDGGSAGQAGTASHAGNGPSSGGDSGEGGAPGGCAFNDTFDGASLSDCWQRLNGSAQTPLIELAVAGGALHLSANGNQNGVWFQGSTQSLVYQLVSDASFKVTTIVHPRKATSPTALPTKDLHVGGLMVRSPASQGGSTENYLLFMAGHSENNNGVVHQGVEFKSTVNGCSNWNEPDWGAAAMAEDAELRICRLGTEFRLYKRVPGAAWAPATPPAGCSGNTVTGNVLTRADMPQTVQVGMGLNFSAPSDLDVAFDAIELVPLPANATAADCTSD